MTIISKALKKRQADAKTRAKKRAKLKALEKSAMLGEKKRIKRSETLGFFRPLMTRKRRKKHESNIFHIITTRGNENGDKTQIPTK